jgi:hypothetical protein
MSAVVVEVVLGEIGEHRHADTAAVQAAFHQADGRGLDGTGLTLVHHAAQRAASSTGSGVVRPVGTRHGPVSPGPAAAAHAQRADHRTGLTGSRQQLPIHQALDVLPLVPVKAIRSSWPWVRRGSRWRWGRPAPSARPPRHTRSSSHVQAWTPSCSTSTAPRRPPGASATKRRPSVAAPGQAHEGITGPHTAAVACSAPCTRTQPGGHGRG